MLERGHINIHAHELGSRKHKYGGQIRFIMILYVSEFDTVCILLMRSAIKNQP